VTHAWTTVILHMRRDAERVGRASTLAAVLICLGPPLTVALTGLHVPLPLALLVPVGVAIAAGTWLRTAPSVPLGLARRHPAIATLWVIVWCAAAGQIVRASVFAYDVTRREWSVAPGNQFRSQHNCLTAYAEAARFAGEGGINVYDSTLYRPGGAYRRMGPLTVDPFHYPPQFLLLPAAVRAAAPDFLDTRRVWFGLQVLLLAGVMLRVASWIGGGAGRRVALGSLAVWALPTTFMALQTGNFQITAIPVALLGAILAWSARPVLGGGLLAYAALGKIYPAMLVLHVIATRRWRLVAWIGTWGVALTGATALVFGLEPFIHFVRDEMPQLASGASFPQTEDPSTFAVNQSIYGFTVKLRALGLVWLDRAAGRHVAQVYALLLAVLAVLSGLRARAAGPLDDGRSRLDEAGMWLGLLNLASFAGPFVGGAYGSLGTSWLVALRSGAGETPARRWAWLAALVPTFLVPWVTPSPGGGPPAAGMLVLSAAWQVGAVAVNAWAAWPRRTARAQAAVVTAGAASQTIPVRRD
jgi:alpha-1,2-mannosyltransferase